MSKKHSILIRSLAFLSLLASFTSGCEGIGLKWTLNNMESKGVPFGKYVTEHPEDLKALRLKEEIERIKLFSREDFGLDLAGKWILYVDTDSKVPFTLQMTYSKTEKKLLTWSPLFASPLPYKPALWEESDTTELSTTELENIVMGTYYMSKFSPPKFLIYSSMAELNRGELAALILGESLAADMGPTVSQESFGALAEVLGTAAAEVYLRKSAGKETQEWEQYRIKLMDRDTFRALALQLWNTFQSMATPESKSSYLSEWLKDLRFRYTDRFLTNGYLDPEPLVNTDGKLARIAREVELEAPWRKKLAEAGGDVKRMLSNL